MKEIDIGVGAVKGQTMDRGHPEQPTIRGTPSPIKEYRDMGNFKRIFSSLFPYMLFAKMIPLRADPRYPASSHSPPHL